jgi:hypothetical protein
MARIKTYGLDSDISADDKVVGTDGTQGNDFGKTKNFSISALKSFIASTNVVQTQVTLNQDDIFSLNNQGSVELLPAPGAGKIIVVEACAYHSPEPTVGTGFSISGIVAPKFGIKVEGAPSHFCSIPDFIAGGFGSYYQYDVAQDVQFNNTGPNSPLILKGGPDLVITNPNPPTAFKVKIIIFYRILEFV